jgi:hypothetical protein
MHGMDLLIGLVAGVAVGFWIYGDAQDRRLKDALMWGVIGVLFGLLGFFAYWLWVIKPNKKN